MFTTRPEISGTFGVASATHWLATQTAMGVLERGGNAFDAMVATELALAVAYPYAGNIGGGGFMVYRKANGETGTSGGSGKTGIRAEADCSKFCRISPVPKQRA